MLHLGVLLRRELVAQFYAAGAYIVSASIFSYPPMIILAVILKRWFPVSAFLPLLSVVGVFTSGLFH